MKVFTSVFFLLLCFLFPVHAYSLDFGDLRISFIDGDVQVNTEDIQDWVAASVNMPLRDGDRIWVPDGGKVELQLRDGTYVRLNENTSLDVLTIERHSFHFYLNTGSAYVNYRGMKDSLIQIDTTVSSIRAYVRAKFRVDTSDKGPTEVSVFKGVVYAENRSGSAAVPEGKALSLTGDSYTELFPIGPPDDWERWNRDRDRRLSERTYSRRYLPDELSSYSYDFDNYGRWVYVRDYGYCWTPSAIVSIGWAPYRLGRWVWIGGDYVWVSYEPWGWVPYHYGRWAFVGSIGWCWVPPIRGSVYWGPGFVGWVDTPNYVAWVPLAPGEIYYGYGYYGPYSVNIINININKVVIKNVYKNVYVNNAVSVESLHTFVTGDPAPVKLRENPFVREKVSVGRPVIKPERRTVMPIIKEIPKRELPPARIRETNVKELKESHPLVKERREPLLKPGQLPKTKVTPREIAPKGKELEKQKRILPSEKVPAKPREIKPPAGRVPEKEKRIVPSERVPERAREVKPPTERGVEKPKEKRVPIERGVERPQEFRPPAEKSVKPRESKPPVERGIEKPKGERPIVEKGIERGKQRELKPSVEKGMEKQREQKPPKEGGPEKQKEFQ